MPNIVVTSTANSVIANMNDYFTGGATQIKKGVWRKENIGFQHRGDYIEALIEGEISWQLSYNGATTSENISTFQIDQVDADSTIASNDELFDLLAALLT